MAESPNNNVTEEQVSQNVILTNPITVEYSPSVIQNTKQIGYKAVGVYTPFLYSTPINPVDFYNITLPIGVWLVESTVCYTADGPVTNMEVLSLATESSTINTNVTVCTYVTLPPDNIRYQRITGVFHMLEEGKIYTVFQANLNGGTIVNIKSREFGNCIATRIA